MSIVELCERQSSNSTEWVHKKPSNWCCANGSSIILHPHETTHSQFLAGSNVELLCFRWQIWMWLSCLHPSISLQWQFNQERRRRLSLRRRATAALLWMTLTLNFLQVCSGALSVFILRWQANLNSFKEEWESCWPQVFKLKVKAEHLNYFPREKVHYPTLSLVCSESCTPIVCSLIANSKVLSFISSTSSRAKFSYYRLSKILGEVNTSIPFLVQATLLE